MAIESKLQIKKGKYGSSKVRAFTCLTHGSWTSRQLCVLSGITYPSLGRALPRWVRFGYCIRQRIDAYGAGDYVYQIEAKGRKWLQLAARYLPNYPLFMQQLNQWQEYISTGIEQELLSLPFSRFITELDKKIKEFQKQA